LDVHPEKEKQYHSLLRDSPFSPEQFSAMYFQSRQKALVLTNEPENPNEPRRDFYFFLDQDLKWFNIFQAGQFFEARPIKGVKDIATFSGKVCTQYCVWVPQTEDNGASLLYIDRSLWMIDKENHAYSRRIDRFPASAHQILRARGFDVEVAQSTLIEEAKLEIPSEYGGNIHTLQNRFYDNEEMHGNFSIVAFGRSIIHRGEIMVGSGGEMERYARILLSFLSGHPGVVRDIEERNRRKREDMHSFLEAEHIPLEDVLRAA